MKIHRRGPRDATFAFFTMFKCQFDLLRTDRAALEERRDRFGKNLFTVNGAQGQETRDLQPE